MNLCVSAGVMGWRLVDVDYHDPVLEKLVAQADLAPKGWSRDVIRSYRKKIQIIRNAKDERDLRNMRGLRLEKLKGGREGQFSIRLNDQFRLILTFETVDDRTAVILEIVDYH